MTICLERQRSHRNLMHAHTGLDAGDFTLELGRIYLAAQPW